MDYVKDGVCVCRNWGNVVCAGQVWPVGEDASKGTGSSFLAAGEWEETTPETKTKRSIFLCYNLLRKVLYSFLFSP